MFILFSTFVFKKTLKLFFPKYYSIGAVVLFMLNPFTVWAALEIRLYALLILLTLSSVYFFFQGFYLRKNQYKIWFVIIGILGVYTQYYFVFLLVALSILLFVSKGWRSFFNYCLWALMIAVIFSPNFIFIKDQMSMHEETQLQYAWYSRIGSISSSPLQFLFSLNELNLQLSFRWTALLCSCILFLILLFKQYREFKKEYTVDFILICQLFVPILALLVIFNSLYSLSDLFYTQRYLTILFPFICLMFPLLSVQNNFIKVLLYLVISVIYIFLLAFIYSPPYIKGPDVIKATHYIQKNELPAEPVIFRDKSLVLVFKHYYHGDNKLIPLRELAFNLNYYKDEFNSTKEIKHLLDSMLSNNNRFILINGPDQDFIANKKVSNGDLDIFIQKNYLVITDTTILGKYDYNYLRIRKLSRPK
jgi:ribosomal protein S24E